MLVVGCWLLVQKALLFASNQQPATSNLDLSTFGHTNLIAKLGGTFVILGLDRSGQILAKLGDVDLLFDRHPAAAGAGGHLAQMMRGPFTSLTHLSSSLTNLRQIAMYIVDSSLA